MTPIQDILVKLDRLLRANTLNDRSVMSQIWRGTRKAQRRWPRHLSNDPVIEFLASFPWILESHLKTILQISFKLLFLSPSGPDIKCEYKLLLSDTWETVSIDFIWSHVWAGQVS